MCYTWIRNILHECINRLDSERSFPLKKMYDIYFFFPLLYAFFFFLWGRGQVGLLVLIYDNYRRYSTSILVLCYIYLHIIYISCFHTISGFVPGAGVPMARQHNMAWVRGKAKRKQGKSQGPRPLQGTFSVNLHFPSGFSSGRAHKRPVASLKGPLGRHLNDKLFLIGTIYRPTEPSW